MPIKKQAVKKAQLTIRSGFIPCCRCENFHSKTSKIWIRWWDLYVFAANNLCPLFSGRYRRRNLRNRRRLNRCAFFCSHHRPSGLYRCRGSADGNIYYFRSGSDLLSISGTILSGHVNSTRLVVGWIIRSRWDFRNVFRCSNAKIRSSQNHQRNIVCLHLFRSREVYVRFSHITPTSSVIDPVIIAHPNQLSKER